MSIRHFVLLLAALAAARLTADPLSKKTDIDFFRDVPSRNLKGLATRSDGRLVAGPMFAEIDVKAPADLLWCLAPGADASHWLVGTGPDGKIVEVTFNPADATYAAREFAKLDDSQVFTVARLPDGAVLAGTSPRGALHLVRDGKSVARVSLPVDSILDLAVLDGRIALAATGNPGRIYRIDLAKFATAGVAADRINDAKQLADRGITLYGEIRDRNVRRLAILADGRVVAGSSPKGNIYAFPAAATEPVLALRAPVILVENTGAEVTDLLSQPDGDLFASIVFSPTPGEPRPSPTAPTAPPTPRPSGEASPPPQPAPSATPPPAAPPAFGGRSTLVWLPANGFPETLVTRTGAAFYHLARHADLVIVTGGEAGEMLGYNLKTRHAFLYPGSSSAQLNAIAPIAGVPGKFLVLRNNVPGLALLDFTATGPREAETRRLDLAVPATLGALRFNRQRDLPDGQLTIEARVSNGSDDVEGWTAWTPLAATGDGWRAADLRGRYVRLRARFASSAPPTAELDKAALFHLPQNRRPILSEFRVLVPNYALIPAAEPPPSAVVTYGQVLNATPPDPDARRKATLSNSQIVPAPGTQVVFWTVTDPDSDNVDCTFSIRRDGETKWTDVVTATRAGFAQFETGHLPDGIYFTRLVATEAAPRPEAERLTATFETDDLIVDHTNPEFVSATARREGDRIIVAVHGRDALSLLQALEVNFTNGYRDILEQPIDGIRDGRDETFVLDIPIARVANATSVEVILYDAAGNGATRRLTW